MLPVAHRGAADFAMRGTAKAQEALTRTAPKTAQAVPGVLY